MKIKIENTHYESNEMKFIADFYGTGILEWGMDFMEALYQTKDGKYVLFSLDMKLKNQVQISQVDNEIKEVFGNPLFNYVEPVQWMIRRGHGRLAQHMFTEYSEIIDSLLSTHTPEFEINKLDLEIICEAANDIIDNSGYFMVCQEVDGEVMYPGCEEYDCDNMDYFDKVLSSSFTGYSIILFPEVDGHTVVPKEHYASAESIIAYYNLVKD
jgi:hypothetical protein